MRVMRIISGESGRNRGMKIAMAAEYFYYFFGFTPKEVICAAD
jgi:hypothetical protein